MRCLGLIAIAAAALFGLCNLAARAVAAEEPAFPYTAYANTDDVYVRSGPGKNYYPTEKLKRGDAVEVYRHDPGGWYAIRPPHGSFSWVPARLLQPTKDHLAVVVGDRVVSRVGSGMSDVRDVIQVRLDRGEQVEILETRSLMTAGHADAWCKITPPSGEFRWVFGKLVDSNSGGALTDTDREASASHARHAAGNSADRRYYMADFDAHGDPDAAPAAGRRNVQRASGESPAAATNGPSAAGNSAAATANLATSDGFQAELNAIDVALSAMVIEDSSTWKFDDLKRRSQTALDHAQTAVERGKARLLLDRIARFEDIKHRRDNVAGIQSATDRKNLQMAGISDVRPPLGLAQVENAAKWDATGKLTSVVSPRPNAPTYALLNSDREVVAFITPAPGVNLKAMVGRQVGISGQRGYMPELRKPHITALRAMALDNPDAVAAGSGTAMRR